MTAGEVGTVAHVAYTKADVYHIVQPDLRLTAVKTVDLEVMRERLLLSMREGQSAFLLS